MIDRCSITPRDPSHGTRPLTTTSRNWQYFMYLLLRRAFLLSAFFSRIAVNLMEGAKNFKNVGLTVGNKLNIWFF